MVARRVLFRLHTAFVAVLFCVSALALPSQAVTPQEGWFVRARETITANGKTQDYFIIDNKMTSDPWYVEMRTTVAYSNRSVFNVDSIVNNDVYEYRGIAFLDDYYRGFSNVDWVVDEDWLVGLTVEGLHNGLGSSLSSETLRLYVFDADRAPIFFMNSNSDSFGFFGTSGEMLVGRAVVASGSVQFGNGWIIEDGFTGYLSLDNTRVNSVGALYNVFSAFHSGGSAPTSSSLNGTSINDLCVAIVPNFVNDSAAYGTFGYASTRVAVSWAIPVSKAPADTQIGDAWPKVQPIDVQFQDKYESWKDAALANSPVTDADNVDDMISGYNEQLASSTELGSDAAQAWDGITPMLAVVEPFSPFLLLASGLFILAFFIKKGMG